jgi:hypothetical protein
VSITPEESLRRLIAARENARGGAEAVANAMAQYIAERTAQDTLRRRRHAAGQYYKAKPGDPPAYASGKLANSMYSEPVSGGLRASAIAGTDDKRASLLEGGGCVLTSTSRPVMKWRDSGRPDNPSGWWSHRRLPLSGEWPAHPFLSTTVEEAIADGSLRQVAIQAGIPFDP